MIEYKFEVYLIWFLHIHYFTTWHKKNLLMAIRLTVKCPYGKTCVQHKVPRRKFPYIEVACGEIFLRRKNLSWKHLKKRKHVSISKYFDHVIPLDFRFWNLHNTTSFPLATSAQNRYIAQCLLILSTRSAGERFI